MKSNLTLPGSSNKRYTTISLFTFVATVYSLFHRAQLLKGLALSAGLFILMGSFDGVLVAQSITCVPGQVENKNVDPCSEECYLDNNCRESGNPCQANDVNLTGIFLQAPGGGDVPACSPGDLITVDLWGNFVNSTGTDRYAVRTRTEVNVDGVFLTELLSCSFDDLPAGTAAQALIGSFSYTCGDVLSLTNTWIGWDVSSSAQCSDPLAPNFASTCGTYPPSKCNWVFIRKSSQLGCTITGVTRFAFGNNGKVKSNSLLLEHFKRSGLINPSKSLSNRITT